MLFDIIKINFVIFIYYRNFCDDITELYESTFFSGILRLHRRHVGFQ